MKHTTTALAALSTLLAAGSVAARGVPQKSIPPSVMLDVRVVESEFKAALASDCAPDRCFIKGCVYESHITLDQPRDASLPGLPSEEGPGSVVPQDFLTRASCAFTHESDVGSADVAKLARRLEKRLSRGWLAVVVVPEALEPIPKSLAHSQPDEEQEQEPEPELAAAAPPVEVELTRSVLMRQLWEELLPHAPWMVALLLFTLALLVVIWAGRRLGARSLEERLMEAQLVEAPAGDAFASTTTEGTDAAEQARAATEDEFAAEQERLWTERLDRVTPDDDVIPRLLREWLKRGDYPMLARALLVFGDRVSSAFAKAPELALRKVEFASYFRDVDEASLPSRAKFFRELNQQSMASLLLSHDDVDLYRSVREDFGAGGVLSLMRELPARYAALLFALAGYEQQHEIAAAMSPELQRSVVGQLLSSTRMSLREGAYLSECVAAVREGKALPAAPASGAHREHGPVLDSATALSALLPHLAVDDRSALFGRENGATPLPQWYEDVVFNGMLSALPDEVRNDVLLEVDVRGLAAWLRMQQPGWRKAFVAQLSEPLQNALAKTPQAATRTEQVRWARRGQSELGTALKDAYAHRGIRFVDLVS